VNPANKHRWRRPARSPARRQPSFRQTHDRLWFDVDAFALPTPFTFGNSGRFVLRATGLVNVDLLLGRNFNITEGTRLEFPRRVL
jgi:hypothetical protein